MTVAYVSLQLLTSTPAADCARSLYAPTAVDGTLLFRYVNPPTDTVIPGNGTTSPAINASPCALSTKPTSSTTTPVHAMLPILFSTSHLDCVRCLNVPTVCNGVRSSIAANVTNNSSSTIPV